MAKAKITLRFAGFDNRYEVVELQNSVAYTPGDNLERRIVESLCNDPAWDATIIGRE